MDEEGALPSPRREPDVDTARPHEIGAQIVRVRLSDEPALAWK
ncbi:hypothetical protein OV203_34115 [Nannocystis sp. ILAH1]|nr:MULTISPECIES: hypothetical protein [unclassified Nannocystis]MCY0992224.1 hypothetical protein [Nannocystis sp. ILAH1]MCY1069187.1 hypothetical protein [Nannocystis sp. RBIL2]